jgi:hypothetical protein
MKKLFYVQRPTFDADGSSAPLAVQFDVGNKWNVSAIFVSLEICRAVQSAIVLRHSQLVTASPDERVPYLRSFLLIGLGFQRLHGPPDEMRLSNKNIPKAHAPTSLTPSSIIYRVRPQHGNGAVQLLSFET